MKRSAIFLRFLLLPSALALSGCGSQAGTKYQGEPLATVRGSVVLETEQPTKDLVPALAFPIQSGFEIVDVSVTGEFPARFTMDVFTPPPEDTATVFKPGEPKLSLAFITAVRPDHPRILPGVTSSDASGNTCDGTNECTEDDSFCSSAGGCFSGHYVCTTYDDCRLASTSGDPRLNPYTNFAGVSRNYFLMYNFTEVPAGTKMANGLNGGKSIPPGYHILQVGSGAARSPDYDACKARTVEDAWSEYDRQHGTTYRSADDVPADQRAAVQTEFGILHGALEVLRPCSPFEADQTITLVDSWTQPLKIDISTDITGPILL